MADKHDIQHSIIELQSKKSRLGLKKASIQADISKHKEMLKYVQQGHETHNDIVAKKNELVAELNEIDLEIMRTKQDLKKRQLLKDEVSEMEQPKAKQWEAEITVLRDNYLKFTKDKTRVSSLRVMAAEFADELTKLLKRIK